MLTVISVFVQVTTDMAQLLGDQKVDAILCVAGGWAGGKCSSKGQSSAFVCCNINHQPLISPQQFMVNFEDKPYKLYLCNLADVNLFLTLGTEV